MATSKAMVSSPSRAAEKADAGRAIFDAALALGLGGDLLLRAWPWGLNATIWLVALCVVALALPRFESLALPRQRGNGWLWAALGFSLMLAWRSSPVLQTINVTAVVLCLGMVAFRTTARAIRLAGITEYAANLATSSVQMLVGMQVLLVRHLDWRSITAAERSPRLAAVGRGLAIAALPVLVFGALFASADIFFRDLLRDAALLSPDDVFSHLTLWALFAWLAGSYLWGSLLAEREPVPEPPRISWLRFDFIEAGVVFGLVDALFMVFVGVQFRYLFGGAGRVESSSSLTYAEYARRGFFELVAVAALAVPFLLLTHWLLPRGNSRLHRFYSGLAGLLVVLVFVVMASAVQRMRLYQETFGLTELRLYTTAFMAWLFVVFAWLALTVLRGRRDRFAFGVFIAGLAVVVGLNALNPDALIVRRNAAIAGTDRPFDSEYVLSLSPDSVPSFVANFDKMAPRERCLVGGKLQRRYLNMDGDWRSWSWGRFRAHRAVSSSDELATACD
ncbi:MAG: DUF4173 domain-containing protein [Chloroflexi bacterium]|nr:DUF4173 domain-containing protein [Chloroflexota bacterium]